MTNEIAAPEREAQEPSMFDTPEWTNRGLGTANPDEVKFAGVRFQRVGKVYHYIAEGFELKLGDWVVVDTARGRQMGQVATLKPPRDTTNLESFKYIERLATGRDMAMRHFFENKELEAMIACRAESNALGLPIKIVKAEYSFDGQTLTFLFSSDQEERVETNELRQVMSRLYRARIETRQISPREVAKIVGGMGACGIEQRCCSRFLTEFSPISIKHAKEQGLSLNPHDITGMCGRLRCCLIYEYEQYVEARRHLPKKNVIVGTPMGQGKVVDVMPMRDSVVVRIGDEEPPKEVVVHREQIVPLEELKRLQEKAASGTCDKHESGQCDCGKNKTSAAEAVTTPTPQAEPALADADARQQDNEPAKARKKKKKKAGPQQSGPTAQQAPSSQRAQPPVAQSASQSAVQKPSHKRHPPHATKHQRPSRQRPFGVRSSEAPAEMPPDFDRPVSSEADAGSDVDTGSATPERKIRRPLRRPLQRR
jgi:cell fate regulator YaaT (PSP1 superfamily)